MNTSSTPPPRTTKKALAAVVLAGVAAVTAAVTVAVEHHVHGRSELTPDEHHEGEHEAHGAREVHDRVTLSPAALRNAGLALHTAGPDEVVVTLSLPGEVSLDADTLAHVTPQVGGTVRVVKKQLGDTVAKGEVLAVLDSREAAEASRELSAAKERLALAEASLERAERLHREKISAEKDYLSAKQAAAEARIDHRSAQQKASAIGGGGGAGYSLVAPFAGTIIDKHISVGEVLREDTQAFTIADLSNIWVNVTVYAKDLGRVRVGQTAEVRAEGIATPATGTITFLGAIVGESTRSATARVVLREPGPAWRPGLFATAEVAVDSARAAVVVYDEGVQRVEGREVVFVDVDGAFEARTVKLGRRGASGGGDRERRVEVLEGLSEGERYVGKNSFLLKAELGKSEAGHEH